MEQSDIASIFCNDVAFDLRIFDDRERGDCVESGMLFSH
jgi:hypothetical protein